jgi:hypothetical protein
MKKLRALKSVFGLSVLGMVWKIIICCYEIR